MTESPKDRILASMADLGLTVTAEFVPFSQSRNAKPQDDGKPWLSLNWRVTLSRNGKAVLTTEYSAGAGHAPACKVSAEWLKRVPYSEGVARQKLVEAECERGKPMSWMFASRDAPSPVAKAPPIMPESEAVVWSLVQDSDVLNYAKFEEWAEGLGFDPDSRKAETIYRASLEIALALRNAIGDAGIEALRTAGEDY
jgi:hypothetical protein